MINFSQIASFFFFILIAAAFVTKSSCSAIINPSKVKQISWKPRAFVYEGFLTDEECNHLVSLAKKELKRSAVADNESGESKLSEVRTSSGMFISKAKDPIVAGIEDKIATWAFLPKENGEDIQVLRYEEGQKYEPHYDYFSDKVNIVRGGHRLATVLMYLSDVEKGGETVFPEAEGLSKTASLSLRVGVKSAYILPSPDPTSGISLGCCCSLFICLRIEPGDIFDLPRESTRRRSMAADDTLSECARKGIAVKPRKGDALLFFSLHPNAVPDPMSLHGGCPVIEGEKWSATKWIHVDSFDKIVGSEKSCADQNENCERWAALGECTKNPEYMVGSSDLPGSCRKSCKAC